jgi:hypothetical protein
MAFLGQGDLDPGGQQKVLNRPRDRGDLKRPGRGSHDKVASFGTLSVGMTMS